MSMPAVCAHGTLLTPGIGQVVWDGWLRCCSSPPLGWQLPMCCASFMEHHAVSMRACISGDLLCALRHAAAHARPPPPPDGAGVQAVSGAISGLNNSQEPQTLARVNPMQICSSGQCSSLLQHNGRCERSRAADPLRWAGGGDRCTST